uniref:Uncharacterized protein n=1 Tax=Octopus bimaculoides TaxID=37653 RepID=A0A0L8HNQ4_OCTBM
MAQWKKRIRKHENINNNIYNSFLYIVDFSHFYKIDQAYICTLPVEQSQRIQKYIPEREKKKEKKSLIHCRE